jgi:hypothetical protein
MVEQDEVEGARAKAETARARAEWEARKKEGVGGQVNSTEEQAVELPSPLRDTLKTLQGSGAAIADRNDPGVEPTKKGTDEERVARIGAEGRPSVSQAASDEEVVRAAFKINPVGTALTEQVADEPGREQRAGEDAVLKS